MRDRQTVFVDSGAWIALALVQDPLHGRARESWDKLLSSGALIRTSIPVVLETFTFLDRNADRDVALAWKGAIERQPDLEVIECRVDDLRHAWSYFTRRELHKLSAVDATSFAIMKRRKIRTAFAFDHHFAAVGFRLVG